jgi:hypothetical protein
VLATALCALTAQPVDCNVTFAPELGTIHLEVTP